MDERQEPWWAGARSLHPLIALLIAAVAAVGAIAQCGLLLDSAAGARSDALASVPAWPDAAVKAVVSAPVDDGPDAAAVTRVSRAN